MRGFVSSACRPAWMESGCRRQEEFDLVIVDVNLPEQDGFEVFAWLKQDFRYSRTPIIFISGRWNEENRRRALELGVADCIDKPFDAPAFVRRISPSSARHRHGRTKVFPTCKFTVQSRPACRWAANRRAESNPRRPDECSRRKSVCRCSSGRPCRGCRCSARANPRCRRD